MNLDQYEYKSDESFLDYEFYSEGPKGRIKKIVHFQFMKIDPFSYYNLTFEDWNEKEIGLMISSLPITRMQKRYWQR